MSQALHMQQFQKALLLEVLFKRLRLAAAVRQMRMVQLLLVQHQEQQVE